MAIARAGARSGMVLCGAVLALHCLLAQAQKPPAQPGGFPAKPVRILIGLAAGGGVDSVVRPLAARLQDKWGVGVVVENRPSAGGIVAMDLLQASPPDGHTWLASGTQLELAAVYYRTTLKVKPGAAPAYDVLKSFEPMVQMTSQPYLLVVHSALPIRSVKELIAWARARPGEMTYATPGVGSPVQLGQELFNQITGMKMTHIPYKGGGASLTDLATGRVQESFLTTLTAINLARQGSVRALAVSGPRRLESVPEVPTLAEAGVPDFEMGNAYGLFTRAGTPAASIDIVNRDVHQLLTQPDSRARLAADGAEPGPQQSPAQYRAKIERNVAQWMKVVESAGITPD